MKVKITKLSGASSDSMFLIFVKLITMMLGLWVTRILAGTLSISEYGTYSQIMLMVSTIASITILGMADGANYFFYKAENIQRRNSYISTIFALQYIISMVCGIVLIVCSGFIVRYFDNANLKNLILYVAILPIMQNSISILQVLFISIGKARQIAIRNLIISLGRLISFYIACHILNSVFAVLLFTVVLDLIQIIYFRIVLKKNRFEISIKNIRFSLSKKIISYCIPMAMFLILSTLTRDCDRYVISAFTDTETLAIYTNAAKILPFDIIMSSFCTVLLPYLTQYIVKENFSKATRLYKLFFELSFVTTSILASAAIVSAPMLMELLYSSKYLVGINIFVIYILVDIFRFTNITLILSAAGQTKKLMYISGISLVLNLILNIILFSTIGIAGPAISTLIVTVITGLEIQISSTKILKCKIRDIIDISHFLKFLLVMICGMIIFLGISNFLITSKIHYIVRLFIIGVGFGIIMVVFELKRIFYLMKEINKFKL